MPHYNCAAANCLSYVQRFEKENIKDINFFSFPHKTRERSKRKIWLKLLRLPVDIPLAKYHRVCSRHFVDGEPTHANPNPTLFEHNR